MNINIAEIYDGSGVIMLPLNDAVLFLAHAITSGEAEVVKTRNEVPPFFIFSSHLATETEAEHY